MFRRSSNRRFAATVLPLLLAACSGTSPSPNTEDSGSPDTGTVSADAAPDGLGIRDAAFTPDARADSTAGDAAEPDAAHKSDSGEDANIKVDAAPDANEPADAGVDAKIEVDAGMDSGSAPDTGVDAYEAVDSGVDSYVPLDAGHDATVSTGDASGGDATVSVDATPPVDAYHAPDAPSCPGACSLGASQCTDGGFESCEQDAGTCPAWVPTACGDHQSCAVNADAGAQCSCLPTPCTGAGSICQNSGTTIDHCLVDTKGCPFVADASTCTTPETCSTAGGNAACSLSCSNTCDAGQTACGVDPSTSASGVETCTFSAASGCWSLSSAVGCSDTHQTCALDSGVASCTCVIDPTCKGTGWYCTSNQTAVVDCTTDGNKCSYPLASTPPTECTGGLCVGTPGTAGCCVNACTVGESQCSLSGALQTCAVVDGGCSTWVAATDGCASNQTCTSTGSGSASCVCDNAPGCSVAGDTCSAGGGSYFGCSKDLNGCWVASITTSCLTPLVCTGAAGAAECACPTPGQAYCGSSCIDVTSNAASCGRCGHSCLGSACSDGMCQAAVLVSGVPSPFDTRATATNVYWTDNIGVRAVLLDGGGAATLSTLSSAGVYETQELALVAGDPNLYLTAVGGGIGEIILRQPLDGGAAATLASAGTFDGYSPYVAVAPFGVFWTDGYQVETVPRDGGALSTVSVLGIWNTSPGPIGIQANDTAVYWVGTRADAAADGAIEQTGVAQRLAADGGITTIWADPIANGPWGLAIDSAALYWTNSDLLNGSVVRVLMDGGSSATLATGQASPADIATDGNRVYWTTGSCGIYGQLTDGGGAIMSALVDGGSLLTLASGQNCPQGISLNDASVYWANFGGVNGGDASIMTVAKP